MEEFTVFAPKHPQELHDLIVEIFSRKMGKPVADYHQRQHQWLEVSMSKVSANDTKHHHLREISLRELYEMPDYTPPPPPMEMTVAEISEKLGHEVKIIK